MTAFLWQKANAHEVANEANTGVNFKADFLSFDFSCTCCNPFLRCFITNGSRMCAVDDSQTSRSAIKLLTFLYIPAINFEISFVKFSFYVIMYCKFVLFLKLLGVLKKCNSFITHNRPSETC